MNQLLQTQSTDEKELLVYYYRKIQDVDEVILQLLNEAGLDGFIKSSVNKAESTINYNITGYKKWADMAADGMTAGKLASALEDLYRLLAYLEDSFIDIEYVLLDTDYMFIHPETGKIQLVVIPCQTIVNEGYTLTDCVDKMFEGFTSHQNGEKADQLHAKMHRGVRSLRDLKEIAEILRSFDDEEQSIQEEPEDLIDLTEDFEDEKVPGEFDAQDYKIEMEAERDASFFEMPENAEVPVEEEMAANEQSTPGETAALEGIVSDAEEIKNDDEEQENDAEYMRQQIREDVRHELESELTEKIKQNLRIEVENELREKIWAELSETFTQNMRHDVENELREKIQAELEEKYQEKEAAKEEAAEADEKVPYLIRKKTGEIIQLNKQTFIIGKLDTCCDYVIRGNNAISRLHAVIKYREDTDSYFIVDCNSTNHTYLNGRRIEAEQPVELKDGMHIHLALEEFVFQLR